MQPLTHKSAGDQEHSGLPQLITWSKRKLPKLQKLRVQIETLYLMGTLQYFGRARLFAREELTHHMVPKGKNGAQTSTYK